MTRCKHCSYNNQLKSSAYNTTGQSYELQLTAHNAMTNHLRRVLLAKSVVDSGKTENGGLNKHNIRRRAKRPVRKSEINLANESLSKNLINRLAYDTKRHPNEVASMSWRSGKCSSAKKGKRSDSTDSSEDSSLRDHRNSNRTYGDKFRAECCSRRSNTEMSPSRERGNALRSVKKKHKGDFDAAKDDSEESDVFENANKHGKSDHRYSKHAFKTFHSIIPCVTSSSQVLCPGTPEFFASLIASTSEINSDRFWTNSRTNMVNANEDVSAYVRFVYDITKEIMDRGYYSDDEMERVFRKHFERNLGQLSENKMLQEINCLKRALNLNYDSDDDAEAARSFERLQTDLWIPGGVRNKADSLNAERIIDPRTDIVVSKEDVITTLLEMDLNPDQAREICNNLQNISKQSSLVPKGNQSSTAEKREGGIENGRNNTDVEANCNCETTAPSGETSSNFQTTSVSNVEKIIVKFELLDSGFTQESSSTAEVGRLPNAAEKEEVKQINVNSGSKEHGDEDLCLSPGSGDSPTVQKSIASTSRRAINKVQAISDDWTEVTLRKPDEPKVAVDLEQKSQRNDD